MRRLRAHPVQMTLLAFAIAAGTIVVIAVVSGTRAFGHAWTHLHPLWIVLTICGELLAIPAYIVLYRTVAEMEDGPELPPALLTRLVIAGFGPFAPDGGFALDKRALQALAQDEDFATVRVLGLGALEWALLAPAACVTAIVLLATGDPRPMKSLLWPWVLAVPIGFAIGLWLATPARIERFSDKDGRWREKVTPALQGVGVLHTLARELRRHWLAWIGGALYWVFDIGSFYGAVHFIGLHADLGETILAYATGYALTRRSMPLGGAGVTELLMTLALHWVGQPIGPALAAVVVYRIFNFALPAVPALLIRFRIRPLLNAAEEDREASQSEVRQAAEPGPGR